MQFLRERCLARAEPAVDPDDHRPKLSGYPWAFVWLNSASAAGSAGAAAAGWAVDTFGAHGGFAVAAMATGVMAVLACEHCECRNIRLQRGY